MKTMREMLDLMEMTWQEKVKALRDKTVKNGCTPAEEKAAKAKADEIEGKHSQERPAKSDSKETLHPFEREERDYNLTHAQYVFLASLKTQQNIKDTLDGFDVEGCSYSLGNWAPVNTDKVRVRIQGTDAQNFERYREMVVKFLKTQMHYKK